VSVDTFVLATATRRDYTAAIPVSPNSVDPGVYKVAVAITYESSPGTPGPIAGFHESGMLQVYDPGSSTRIDETDLQIRKSDRDATLIYVTLTSRSEESLELTPKFLELKILPYVYAIREIQYVIDELFGQEPHKVLIKSISQDSPISISLAGVSEAVQLILDNVISWRRKHGEKIAHLLEQEKQAEIEDKKAGTLEKRANAQKNRADVEKILAEAAHVREETEQKQLQNESMRLELDRSRFQLAFDILEKLDLHLSENEHNDYVEKLLKPIDVIISSDLEITRDST
jgi:hypothetical protein